MGCIHTVYYDIPFINYVFSVLVLDEMDQLDSKNQEVLYTMFEWPSFKKSRLVLIGRFYKFSIMEMLLQKKEFSEIHSMQ